VKRAISGKGRRGAPPLPRQRGALRVVQISLLALALFLGNLAYGSWQAFAAAEPNAGMVEVVALAVVTMASAAGCLWMGLRTIRGPQPPSLD
ncbi:MAG TPA: hypothetical protein VM754_10935, partial [Actinomycetota bacterium]|nr:hypothetical protein [Actinomycetota bacterium]